MHSSMQALLAQNQLLQKSQNIPAIAVDRLSTLKSSLLQTDPLLLTHNEDRDTNQDPLNWLKESLKQYLNGIIETIVVDTTLSITAAAIIGVILLKAFKWI